ncbi:nuclear transport factor 2 family protein [Streptomyces phyllanthi]|uniref:Nuclear transport factor 2 family protein n=1 Tax=Streptomyces phyllanthi TaxID=1803180 RepID=A0A5N8W8U0_9ACTN|nr:nuclear transport factor 2 family protein [Streptomyces phyllanthi]MPY43749.1 nuclear transport factor 2 family protein [Streptomyces phyllanthi]
MRHRISVKSIPVVLAVALLSACSGTQDETADKPTLSVESAREPRAGSGAPADEQDTKEQDDVANEKGDGTGGVEPAAQAYVDAVAAKDLDALVDAFHPDARLIDVGREFNGREEIRAWADAEVIGGRLTVLKDTPKKDGTTLLVRFAPGGSGGFEANYEFDVRDGRIAELNLQYA